MSSLNNSTSADNFQTVNQSTPKSGNLNNKFEKRILDEIVKIFQDNNGSFYFSFTYDLTNSIERQQEQIEAGLDEYKRKLYFWKRADDRFFWNKILLNDLIELNLEENLKDKFILPVIQGFVQIETFENKIPGVEIGLNNSSSLFLDSSNNFVQLKLALISRRSRYRLGKCLLRNFHLSK